MDARQRARLSLALVMATEVVDDTHTEGVEASKIVLDEIVQAVRAEDLAPASLSSTKGAVPAQSRKLVTLLTTTRRSRSQLAAAAVRSID